jgi:hypothetical protein
MRRAIAEVYGDYKASASKAVMTGGDAPPYSSVIFGNKAAGGASMASQAHVSTALSRSVHTAEPEARDSYESA